MTAFAPSTASILALAVLIACYSTTADAFALTSSMCPIKAASSSFSTSKASSRPRHRTVLPKSMPNKHLNLSSRTWQVSFTPPSRPSRETYTSSSGSYRDTYAALTSAKRVDAKTVTAYKAQLLDLLSQAPANKATPPRLTREILSVVRLLENNCPTPSTSTALAPKLAGTWDLIWTTQDRTSPEARQGASSLIINPMENQQYSINPSVAADELKDIQKNRFGLGNDFRTGRSNPFLPQDLQDRLERWGSFSIEPTVTSTQTIDLRKRQVQNSVSVAIKDSRQKVRRGAMSVAIDFMPDYVDPRKLLVQFKSCRLTVPQHGSFELPLGIFGPRGWLRTSYVDDNMRITRGHKGSVFVLTRTKPRRRSV